MQAKVAMAQQQQAMAQMSQQWREAVQLEVGHRYTVRTQEGFTYISAVLVDMTLTIGPTGPLPVQIVLSHHGEYHRVLWHAIVSISGSFTPPKRDGE
jgi:hypothetical protein